MDSTSIKTVGVKVLKNRLSEYLRDVKRGTRVLVTDRDKVVAELREPQADYEVPLATENPLYDEWVRSGKIIPPRSRISGTTQLVPKSSVAVPPGTAKEILNWIRGK